MQSFMSKLNPGGGDSQNDGTPVWMRYLGKGAGVLGGGGAIFFGIWCCITISPLCLVAGIWQILAGLLVIICEAPFCCFFLEPVQKFSGMLESRPVWQKAVLYLVLSLPPISLCLGITTLLGSGLIFATSILYGMQILGKRGSKADAPANAQGANEFDDMDGNYGNEQLP